MEQQVNTAVESMSGLEDLLAGLEMNPTNSEEPQADPVDAASVIEPQGEVATPAPEVASVPGKPVKKTKKTKTPKKGKKASNVAPETPAVDAVKTDEQPAPEAPAVVVVEPKKPVEKRIFFGRRKIERLEHKLGANIANMLVYTTEDAELEGDDLTAKINANKVAFKALGAKVQNRATNVVEFIAGKATNLGKVTESVIRLLSRERQLTTGDKGNLFKKLGGDYSPATARATGNSTLGMLRALGIVHEGAKGTYVPSENSTFLALLSERLGLSFVDNEAGIAEAEAKEQKEREDRAAALASALAATVAQAAPEGDVQDEQVQEELQAELQEEQEAAAEAV